MVGARLSDARAMSADQAGIETPDSLTIFSYVWAAQSLVQLYFFSHWFNQGLILGYVFAALAIAVFLFPGRIGLFVAMVVASIAYFVSQWPFVVNHVFIDTFMSATILVSFVVIVVRTKRLHAQFDRQIAETWFLKFAPVCGAIFAFMYFSIIISKMNSGFFDLNISCLSGMIEEAHAVRPIIAPLLSLASVKFSFWFFIVAESLLPLMLAVPQTRLAAFYFGVPFHVLLGLMGHWPFSAFMISLYVLVAMPALMDVVRTAARRLDAFREGLIPWAPGFLLFAAGNAILLASALVLKGSWLWLVWTLVIAGALIYSVVREHYRHGILKGTGVTELWTMRPGLLWIAFGLVILNSAAPYTGFKTESNVAMYSNMRTEGGVNNHFFMPVVSLFHYQDDLVEVIDSNNPKILKLKSHPARYGFIGQTFAVYIPYFEFRRAVSGLNDGDLQITYRRNGDLRTFRRGEAGNKDANLDVPPSTLLAKLVYLRPVFKGDLSYCLH